MKTVTIQPVQMRTPTVETIFTRRAVRKYKNKEVDKMLIEQVIEAGRMAPSAVNQQVWKFYVITDKILIAAFSKEIKASAMKRFVRSGIRNIVEMTSHLLHFPHGLDFGSHADPVFHGAPVVIFITGPKKNEWAHLDIGMCAQNMMLAAKSMGLDTCPVGFAKYVCDTKHFHRLHIPDTEEVVLGVILGYGNEDPEIHERKKENIFFVH
jgi:nitroreductase